MSETAYFQYRNPDIEPPLVAVGITVAVPTIVGGELIGVSSTATIKPDGTWAKRPDGKLVKVDGLAQIIDADEMVVRVDDPIFINAVQDLAWFERCDPPKKRSTPKQAETPAPNSTPEA